MQCTMRSVIVFELQYYVCDSLFSSLSGVVAHEGLELVNHSVRISCTRLV